MQTATILSDNRTSDPGKYRTEHGLSVLLQSGGVEILLDTGASGLFARHAEELGLDLSQVDYVFLSHGHADHTGGLRTFLELNRKARVLVSPEAVRGRFFSTRGGMHDITAPWPLDLMKGRMITTEGSTEIAGGIHVITRIPHPHGIPSGNRHLLTERDGVPVPDDFRHEMALYADGFLFTGCAHNGLENILEACPWPVHTVLGGFHLLDAKGEDSYETQEELTGLAGRLLRAYPGTFFYTGHCTGDKAFEILQSVMGDRIRRFSCGMKIFKNFSYI